MNVLLVEDDPNTQWVFQFVLEHYNINLTVVDDPSSILAALAAHKSDVIVLDLFLPGTDGYQLLKLIRAHTTLKCCPVIATTAYYTSDSLGELQQAGFDGYLLKPIDPMAIVPYLEGITQHANAT
jgi:CheY-like chemotaxis protein